MKIIARIVLFASLISAIFSSHAVKDSLASKVINSIYEFNKANPDLNAAYEFTHKNKTLFSGSSGYFSIEDQIKLKPDQEMLIASGTKNVIAAAILRLEELGKLKVSDVLAKYFPVNSKTWSDKSLPAPKWLDQITIHHLLIHSSGLKEYIFNTKIDPSKTHEQINQDILHFAASNKLEFQPGEKYAYCNTGYVLLGMIIESVTGLSLRDYLNKAFFAPLNMKHTHLASLQEVIDYRKGLTKKYPELYFASYKNSKFTFKHANTDFFFVPFADGGIITTTEDFNSWHYKLHHGKIISKASYKKMITPYLDAAVDYYPKQKVGYGIFIVNLDDKNLMYYHSGKAAGVRSESGYIPALDIGFTILSNTMQVEIDKNVNLANPKNQIDTWILLNYALTRIVK
jgi:CubicO group peptidase (beta-lactamase class C family)